MENRGAKQRWVIDTNYKDKSTLEDVKFIFEQAEKQLTESLETSTVIINRVNTLATILVTLLIGLVAFIITRLETEKNEINALLITASTAVVYYYFLFAIYLNQNIKSSEYFGIGAYPKDFFDEDFYEISPPEGKGRVYFFYLNEIESYQKRIEENNNINRYRWRIYNSSLRGLIYSPIILLIIYLAMLFAFKKF